ncbi:MAG: ABC transporter permease, partial [Actinomycetota bacterium]
MAGSTLASPSVEAPTLARAPASPGRETWRRFRRHRLALASVAVLAVLVGGVLVGGLIWPLAIDDIDFSAQLQGPSWAHPFG